MSPSDLKSFEIYIDGASRGNPGPAAIGVIISCQGIVVKNISAYIGESTNNVAEYTALIYALEESLLQKADQLDIKTDSELLFKQINGNYKVKNATLKIHFDKAKHLLTGFKKVTISYIPRSENKGADKLANMAFKVISKKPQAKAIARS